MKKLLIALSIVFMCLESIAISPVVSAAGAIAATNAARSSSAARARHARLMDSPIIGINTIFNVEDAKNLLSTIKTYNELLQKEGVVVLINGDPKSKDNIELARRYVYQFNGEVVFISNNDDVKEIIKKIEVSIKGKKNLGEINAAVYANYTKAEFQKALKDKNTNNIYLLLVLGLLIGGAIGYFFFD